MTSRSHSLRPARPSVLPVTCASRARSRARGQRQPRRRQCRDPPRLLPDLSQPQAQRRRLDARDARSRSRGRSGGDLGESGPQAAHAGDAATREASPRRRRLRIAGVRARNLARPRRGGEPEPGPAAAASDEPRRVRQRGARSARDRGRHQRPARRRLGVRLRQRGGRAGGLASPARKLHDHGAQGEPPRDRQRQPGAGHHHLQDARGPDAGLCVRGAPVGNARRHPHRRVPARHRRVRDPRPPAPPAHRTDPRHRRGASSRARGRRRARRAVRGGIRGRLQAVDRQLPEPDADAQQVVHRRRAHARAATASGRRAHHHRGLRRAPRRALRSDGAAVPAQLHRGWRPELARCRVGDHHRSVRDRRRGSRNREPASDLLVPSALRAWCLPCPPRGSLRRRGRRVAVYELSCATGILGRLARLAYRRPPAPEEMEELLGVLSPRTGVFDLRRGAACSSRAFENGIELAIRFLLASPQFVFRFESEPDSGDTVLASAPATGGVFAVSDLDLASRLSFFLWSSIPDAELLDAGDGRTTERSRRASPPGPPDDRRPALVGTGRQLRRPVALPAQPRERGPRSCVVPRLRRQPAPVDADRDRALLPEHPARGPQRGRAARPPTTRSSTSAWRATTG